MSTRVNRIAEPFVGAIARAVTSATRFLPMLIVAGLLFELSGTQQIQAASAMAVSPGSVSLGPLQTQRFTVVSTNVTWSLSPAVGSITAAGLYTAPASITSSRIITVKATSVTNPRQSATATVTLNPPVNVTVTPASVTLSQSQTQTFSATVTNTSNTAVTWSLSPAVGTISSTGLYTAPASITSSRTVTVKATSVANPTKSVTAAVTLNPPLNVTVTPASVTLTQSQTQSFSATVTNTGNTAVTWSLSPVVGSITAAGLYTAPASITSSQTVTVKATSVANPTKSVTATVTLNRPVTVSLTPSSVSLLPSQNQTFTATVSGTSNTAATWSITPASASLVSGATTAVYVAPSTAPTTQSGTITATSMADPSKAATALITLLQAITVSISPSTVSLAPSGKQQFTATVSGTSNTAVTWSINPSVGTISSGGLYKAPSSILTAQTVTITAQSAADPTKSVSGVVSLQTVPSAAQWSIGYWTPNHGANPVDTIQWNGLTHINHVAAIVNADGTLDLTEQNVSGYAAGLISAAHAHNVQVLLEIVQYYSGPQTTNFHKAIFGNLAAFVGNIKTVVNTYGYDGVDLDWEPFDSGATDATDMATFAPALRTALGSKILTTTAYWFDGPYWTANQAPFDRVNVMTYDLTGTYRSVHYAWFNSPLYDDGVLPSLNMSVNYYLPAGFPPNKLGLGLAFYGWKWTGGVLASDPTQGISGPRQVWQTGKAPTGAQINYHDVVPLITQQNYTWDSQARVPYINYLGATPSTYWYLTYDNPQSIQAKVQYIIAQHFGGWIIWNLDGDYIPGGPHPHPLLDAVQIGSAPAVSTPSVLGSGVVGTAYSTSLSATGAAPLQWSLSSGSLPGGLSLSSAGAISGTPTTSGTFTFTVNVGNFAGSSSQLCTITIAASGN